MVQKNLSIFIDESGDFGSYDKKTPYYIVTLIFHNQTDDISNELNKLQQRLDIIGYPNHILHTAPLIRREVYYSDLSIEDRRKILNVFMAFAAKVKFTYKTFIIKKIKNENEFTLIAKISKAMRDYYDNANQNLKDYKKMIVYYDNGQAQLTKIIASIFTETRTEFRKIKPYNYRLFQIADLITTFELINQKKIDKCNSSSEKNFFISMNNFSRNYYKRLAKKKAD